MSDLEILDAAATPGKWGQFNATVGPWQTEAMEYYRNRKLESLDTSHRMSAMTPNGPKRLSEWTHAADAEFAESLVNEWREGRLKEVEAP
jgi:hypothetical protein